MLNSAMGIVASLLEVKVIAKSVNPLWIFLDFAAIQWLLKDFSTLTHRVESSKPLRYLHYDTIQVKMWSHASRDGGD